jgi:hypothetical protein
MSGVKEFNIAASIGAPVILSVTAATVAVTATVSAGAVAVNMATSAVRAYQERKRKEREAIIEREAALQRKIADLRKSIYNSPSRRTVVAAPSNNLPVNEPIAANLDAQTKLRDLRSRLPSIQAEYHNLVESGWLDSSSVDRAFDTVRQALDAENIDGVQSTLRSLDDARITAWREKIARERLIVDYARERLDSLKSQLPEQLATEIATEILQIEQQGIPTDDPDLLQLHQRLSDLQTQIEAVAAAGDRLLEAWQQVGYRAKFSTIDNGDLVFEVETHEGVNTEMRIGFDGEQLTLNGPAEESSSCAARTHEVLQIFQKQGYYLEWNKMDGEIVPEEWRRYYSAEVAASLGEPIANPETITQYTPTESTPERRSVGEGA